MLMRLTLNNGESATFIILFCVSYELSDTEPLTDVQHLTES